MRKAVLGICLLTFLSSCGDRKVKMDPFVAVTSMIDSVATKTKEERPAEPPADDKPIHTEADELFDDFSSPMRRTQSCKSNAPNSLYLII